MVQHKLRPIMKIKNFYILFGFISLLYLGFVAIAQNVQDDRNKSIIKFSHSVHAEEAECADCHSKVSESISLGASLLPTKENCSECHDVDDEENCAECHYEGVEEFLIPRTSEILFNHNLHLAEQDLKCVLCHTGVDEVDYSFESTGSFPEMLLCYNCHSNTNVASNDCEQCHTSTVDLIPMDHQTAGFFKNHKFNASDNCQMCHDENTFCADCHVATTGLVESNLDNDFYTPFSPHNYVDGVKQQNISRIHDLNYRFSHGIDAKGKAFECQSCHQTETFCAECHASEDGDFAMGGILPLSHLATNFVTGLVPGSDHANLAKRDIERCASCHDTQGADANCILCHSDPDGIKGTNPKTHQINFMNDSEGNWHSDGAAICYDCHSNTNIAGVGFCGYCHGADAD